MRSPRALIGSTDERSHPTTDRHPAATNAVDDCDAHCDRRAGAPVKGVSAPGATILCNTPCTLGRIELPTLLTPGSHTLRLANLVSPAGALLDPNPTVRTFQTFRP